MSSITEKYGKNLLNPLATNMNSADYKINELNNAINKFQKNASVTNDAAIIADLSVDVANKLENAKNYISDDVYKNIQNQLISYRSASNQQRINQEIRQNLIAKNKALRVSAANEIEAAAKNKMATDSATALDLLELQQLEQQGVKADKTVLSDMQKHLLGQETSNPLYTQMPSLEQLSLVPDEEKTHLQNELNGIVATKNAIAKLEEENETLTLAAAKGDDDASEKIKENNEKIKLWKNAIKEAEAKYGTESEIRAKLSNWKTKYDDVKAQKQALLKSTYDISHLSYEERLAEYDKAVESGDKEYAAYINEHKYDNLSYRELLKIEEELKAKAEPEVPEGYKRFESSRNPMRPFDSSYTEPSPAEKELDDFQRNVLYYAKHEYELKKLGVHGEEYVELIKENEDATSISGRWDSKDKIKEIEKEWISRGIMTQDEIDDLKYYIKDQYQKEKNEAKMKELYSDVTEYNDLQELGITIGSSLVAFGGNILTFFDSIYQAGRELFGGEKRPINAYSDINASAQWAKTVREAVMADQNGTEQFFYGIGCSLLDMGTAIAASGGIGDSLAKSVTGKAVAGSLTKNVTLASMSLNAGGGAALDAMEKTSNPYEVATIGISSAMFEALAEKLPLDNLFKIAGQEGKITASMILKAMGSQAVSEFGEEAATETANIIMEAIVLSDKSDWAQTVQKYIDEGYSESEARSKALVSMVGRIGVSGLAGAISGGFSGGGASTINYLSYNYSIHSTGNTLIKNNQVEQLIELAETSGIDISAYNLEDKKGNYNASAIGELYFELMRNKSDAVSNALKEMGVSEADVAVVQSAIFKEAFGQNLSTEMHAKYNQYEDIIDNAMNDEASSLNVTANDYMLTSLLVEIPRSKASNTAIDVSGTDSADVNIDANIDTEVNVESSSDIDATTESEIAEADYLDNETLESVEENEYDKTIRLMDGRAKPLTEAQAYVQSVGRALGYNVVIDDLSRGGRTASGKSFKATTRGFFDGQTIYLHEGQTTFEAIVQIFKHEITHYSELNPKMYEKYADAVFDSKVFENWISEQKVDGEKVKGRSHPVRLGQYRESIIKKYEKHGVSLESKNDTDGRSPADREIIARFTSEMLFNEKGNTLERFISEVNSEDRNAISQFIHDFISWLKARLKGEKVSIKIVKLENRFAAVLRNVDNTNAQKNNTTNDGDVQYKIETLENGRKFVKADRQVIRGDDSSKWRNQIEKYINDTIRQGKDVTVYGIDGDALTITQDTAGKARFRNFITQRDGTKRLMTDEEYAVKLRAESHIDELAQVSRRGKQDVPDYKHHSFAKDGFNYRTAYFMDKDGKYYRITLSVGKNGKINTVYNVGKIKETERPLVAQRPNRFISTEDEFNSVSNPNVSQDTPKVNTHYTQGSENYSSLEQNDDGNSYSFEDTHSGENLYDTPDYLKPQSEREWSAFARSFANKTNDLKNGEQRNIIIYTADNVYFVTADGYMSGTIVLKESIYASEEYINKIQEEFINGTFVRTESDDKLFEGIRSNRGRNHRRHASLKEILALEENEGLDGNSYIGNDERSDTSSYNYTHRNEAGLDDSAFSMPENDDEVSYSFEDDVASLTEQRQNGEISESEYRNELQRLMNEATEKYGAIEKGENPKVDVTVPKQVSDKRNTRRFVRTVLESGTLTDEMVADTDKAILKDALSYVPISNEEAIKKATKALENGTIEQEWRIASEGNGVPDKYDMAKGELLLKIYAEKGDTRKLMQQIADVSEAATRAGQATQALSLLKKMDGVGQLYYVQKVVNKLNRDLEKRHKGKFERITIDETLAGQLVTAKPGMEAENIADEIMQDIAEQVPVTFLDMWNAWRYLSMLGNLKTHNRNLLGNAVFVPAVKLKDAYKSALEKAFVSQENRTTSAIVKKEYKDFAESDFEKVVDIITGNGKKNPSDIIRDKRKIFVIKGIEIKPLEWLRTFNSEMLEKEDMIFLKMHYKRALGGFLQARNIDLNNFDEATLNEARNYAIEEAQKATYRDASKLASNINKLSKSHWAANLIIEGNLPFKKTVINVAKRGIEYSPLGLITALTKGKFYDLKKGNITMSQYLDRISAGLSGTSVFLLGMFLAYLGVAIGGLGFDEEDTLKRLNGEQEYSIELFGHSYTVDWMAPVCIPFFMGVEFANTFTDSEKEWYRALADSFYAVFEPMINLSMLKGIRDTIAAAQYSENKDILTQIGGETVSNYFSQALPTLFGQVARSFDDTRRSNYVSGDATGFEKKLYEFFQNAMGKTLGLENQKMPYTDAFGEKDTNDNFFLRVFENMLSPGYSSTIKETDVNAELADLFEQTGDGAVIPRKASKSFTVGGERIYLDADQYTQYNTKKGQLSQNMLVDLFNSKGYKSMTYTKKAEAVSEVYKYANMLAKTEVSDYQLEGKYAKWKEYQGYGYDVSELIALDIADKDFDGSGGVSKSEYAEAVNNTDMSQQQKNLLIGLNEVEGKSDYSKNKTKGFGTGDWYYKENGQYVKITSAAELNRLRRNNVDTYVYTGNYTDVIDELWRAYRGY